MRVQFASASHASVAARSLAVDTDLQPERAGRHFNVEDDILVVTLEAVDARLLRVITLSFFDMLSVVLRTLREFT